MPYAKMYVDYKIGNDLLEKIKAVVLDSQKNKSVVEVNISYQEKPMVCSGCKSLGHLVHPCPKIKRIWVRKEHLDPKEPSFSDGTNEEQQIDTGKNGTAKNSIPISSVTKDLSISSDESSPPIPTSGLTSKTKLVDAAAKLKGILKNPKISSSVVVGGEASGLGTKKKIDAEGYKEVVHKKAKKNGASPPELSKH